MPIKHLAHIFSINELTLQKRPYFLNTNTAQSLSDC